MGPRAAAPGRHPCPTKGSSQGYLSVSLPTPILLWSRLVRKRLAPLLFGVGHPVVRLQEGVGGIILEEGLQKHANGPEDADKDKDPQEEAVDDHRHVLPVLAHLEAGARRQG